VLNAQGIGDLTDLKTGCGKFFFGVSNQFFMNMLLFFWPVCTAAGHTGSSAIGSSAQQYIVS